MMLSSFGTEIAELDISYNYEKQIQKYASLKQHTVFEAQRSIQAGRPNSELIDFEDASEIGYSEQLIQRLLDLGQYKKLAEFIMMRDGREERYALETMGTLREMLKQRMMR